MKPSPIGATRAPELLADELGITEDA